MVGRKWLHHADFKVKRNRSEAVYTPLFERWAAARRRLCGIRLIERAPSPFDLAALSLAPVSSRGAHRLDFEFTLGVPIAHHGPQQEIDE